MWGASEICQSCGLRVEDDKYGTNPDGTFSEDYCSECYEEGEFNEPTVQMEEMIERSARKMSEDGNISEEDAKRKLDKAFPRLKRWNDTW